MNKLILVLMVLPLATASGATEITVEDYRAAKYFRNALIFYNQLNGYKFAGAHSLRTATCQWNSGFTDDGMAFFYNGTNHNEVCSFRYERNDLALVIRLNETGIQAGLCPSLIAIDTQGGKQMDTCRGGFSSAWGEFEKSSEAPGALWQQGRSFGYITMLKLVET
mmetsp:Transcript_20614/g.50590  ORF Transcript_20614/g.50590 Transcript_20614/m.50590 type:complete len:165 (+) Transcript_20614:281-775(+)